MLCVQQGLPRPLIPCEALPLPPPCCDTVSRWPPRLLYHSVIAPTLTNATRFPACTRTGRVFGSAYLTTGRDYNQNSSILKPMKKLLLFFCCPSRCQVMSPPRLTTERKKQFSLLTTSASLFGAGPPQGLGRVSRLLDKCR